MADNNAQTEIPDIKLAKVGDKREKKKGGAGWLGQGAGKGGFSGALGGSGAGSGAEFLSALEGVFGKALAALLPKILVAAMVGCLGIGALSVGKALKALQDKGGNKAASAKPKAFAAKEKAAPQTDGPIGRTDSMQNSIGMVSGSLDGKTQAERDADAAAAKAAADKAAADQAKADASAAPKDQPDAKAGPAGPVDPAALAAAAAAGAGKGEKSGESKKGFGAFSSQLGGAAHGGGLSSGFGFGKTMENAGKLGGSRAFGNMHATDSRTSSRLGSVSNPGRGIARKQLGRAAQLSAAASRSAVPETMSQNAQNAFQSPIGGNQAITGGGAGSGGPGTTGGGSGATGSSGGSGSGGGSNPSMSGNAGVDVPDDCGAIFPDGGYVNGGGGGCVCPPGMDGDGTTCSKVHSTNATPGQKMIDMAALLLKIAGVLLLLAGIFGMMKSVPYIGPALYALARYLAMAACALSAIVTLIGISLIAMGGQSQGQGIFFTIVGGLMTIISYIAADKLTPDATSSTAQTGNTQAASETSSQGESSGSSYGSGSGSGGGEGAGEGGGEGSGSGSGEGGSYGSGSGGGEGAGEGSGSGGSGSGGSGSGEGGSYGSGGGGGGEGGGTGGTGGTGGGAGSGGGGGGGGGGYGAGG